ncbi:MAG: RING finger protein [Armatimonadota bacterium]
MTADSNTGLLCPLCQMPLKFDDQVVLCSACRVPQHLECWQQSGRCATAGCAGTPLRARASNSATVATQPQQPDTPPQQPPTDTSLDRLLAEIYLRLRQEQFDEAQTRLAQAKELAPGHPAVLEIEGDLFFARRRYRDAEAVYRQAFQADPANAKLEEKYATALIKVHEPEYNMHAIPDEDSIWGNKVKRPVTASALLSALLPGLGQWYNGEIIKGGALIVVSVMLFGAEISYVMQSYSHLHKQGLPFSMGGLFGPLFTGGSLFVIFLMLAVWVYSIIDAALVAHSTE